MGASSCCPAAVLGTDPPGRSCAAPAAQHPELVPEVPGHAASPSRSVPGPCRARSSLPIASPRRISLWSGSDCDPGRMSNRPSAGATARLPEPPSVCRSHRSRRCPSCRPVAPEWSQNRHQARPDVAPATTLTSAWLCRVLPCLAERSHRAPQPVPTEPLPPSECGAAPAGSPLDGVVEGVGPACHQDGAPGWNRTSDTRSRSAIAAPSHVTWIALTCAFFFRCLTWGRGVPVPLVPQMCHKLGPVSLAFAGARSGVIRRRAARVPGRENFGGSRRLAGPGCEVRQPWRKTRPAAPTWRTAHLLSRSPQPLLAVFSACFTERMTTTTRRDLKCPDCGSRFRGEVESSDSYNESATRSDLMSGDCPGCGKTADDIDWRMRAQRLNGI